MSAFRSITMRSSFRAASPAVRQAGAFRSFQSGRVLQVVKENKEGNAERAQEIESAKQEELKKQKQGKNEYNDKLASESESAIKGEKHDKSIDQMQKEGAQAAQNEKK